MLHNFLDLSFSIVKQHLISSFSGAKLYVSLWAHKGLILNNHDYSLQFIGISPGWRVENSTLHKIIFALLAYEQRRKVILHQDRTVCIGEV